MNRSSVDQSSARDAKSSVEGSKHTAGPWEIGPRASVISSHPFAPVKICDLAIRGGLSVALANGHLIAAAPDLLEACLKVRRINAKAAAEGYLKPEEWGDELFACNAALSAAIAKARGSDAG